jgi:tRNA dimethylallyltransferase
MRIKIIAVIGPTASGKTSLAVNIAKEFNGELINTDSRQIYKYMDIGTAKGEVEKVKGQVVRIKGNGQLDELNIKNLDVYKLEGAKIHLINIVEPNQVLTLAIYQKLAYEVIQDISKRNKLPILVGGTGLYVDAITKGYDIPKIKPDIKLRKELNSKTIKKLQDRLAKLNKTKFKSLNNSDNCEKLKLNVLFLIPKNSREKLFNRINRRAEIIVNSGLIEEVKSLIKRGYSFSKPAMTAISYPIVKEYLDDEISKYELIERFRQGDRNYARRQITWFKRYKADEVKKYEEAVILIKKFLKS